jgi:hypothetical protein
VNVVLGAVSIAGGIFLIVRRHSQAQSWVRSSNRMYSLLRMKRRYGEKELRHNVRAAVIVGASWIVLGISFIVGDVRF